MNQPRTECARIRPLLFAAAEGEVDREERLQVQTHLAVCAACRAWDREERALTALLSSGALPPAPRRVRQRVLAFAGALGLVAMLVLLLPAATPDGSLLEQRLGRDLQWQISGERTLRGDEVVDVPAFVAATARLGHGVTLESVGPARFALHWHGRRWHVVVQQGMVLATVAKDAVLAVGQDAAQQLRLGRWLLSAATAGRQPAGDQPTGQDPVRGDPASLLAAGLERFTLASPPRLADSVTTEQEHLAAAERLLRAVLAAAGVTPAQAAQALLYLAASVARQGRADEAFALETEYVTRYPEGDGIAAVRFWMAVHLLERGRHDDARQLFERVLQAEGDTPLGQAARSHLGMLARDETTEPAADATAPPQPASQEPVADAMTTRRALPAGAGRCAYLVVPVALDAARQADAGYLAAARAAAGFHGAETWAWDGADFAALRDRLLRRPPENVLFVLRPAQLDLVLHRRLLLLCAGIDDDWFVDVAFGYLTAEDGAGCERLWQRIARLHERGHLSGLWWQGSVTSNPTSLVYEDGAGPLVKAAGFRGPHYYWSTADADRDAVIERSLATLPEAAVVELTGCGDPQGIWLFDDRRNLQRDRHWDYAPERVGHDPDHSMPRLLARRFRALQLDAPILWSGTCHSGAVCNVFVEGDIVATFGRTTAATVHVLAPEDSLALSWLAAGAAGMLVPIGANHGMSVAMETDFALRHGASLGEVVKSTWDDVLLAAEGRLVLDLPVAGQAHQRSEAVMQGGGANRILIGDPALRPFRRVESAAERVVPQRTAAGLRVQVERAAGWQPRAWDMYGTTRDRDWRALVRVDLVEAGLGECTEFTARVTARGPDGAALPYAIARVAVEDHHGRRFLHLQANGPRAALERKAATIVFDVAAK